MPSAACYTNKRRVIAEASLTKVQYPQQIAVQNTLLPTENCSRNFSSVIYYTHIVCRTNCNKYYPPQPIFGSIIDGGSGLSEYTTILDGGSGTTESTTILDGGNS